MIFCRKAKVSETQEKNTSNDEVKCENKVPADCTRLAAEQTHSGKNYSNPYYIILMKIVSVTLWSCFWARQIIYTCRGKSYNYKHIKDKMYSSVIIPAYFLCVL
jgi:hypothetical protein